MLSLAVFVEYFTSSSHDQSTAHECGGLENKALRPKTAKFVVQHQAHDKAEKQDWVQLNSSQLAPMILTPRL